MPNKNAIIWLTKVFDFRFQSEEKKTVEILAFTDWETEEMMMMMMILCPVFPTRK